MNKLLTLNRSEILKLAALHGIANIRVFGSVVRGEDEPDSDIDFLVDVQEDRDLFDLGAFLMDLQELLHRSVDIVTERALHRKIRSAVLKEAIPL